ncbi:MAG: indolepyruvate oxidoreductase subunit beta family protein [Hyphococcus sp.]
MNDARPIKIAIAALGGQGGGVLSNWIVALGEANGYVAQSTSVPGVAQRTGATIYYVELFPEESTQAKGKAPVLALMPMPGDVDIVIAAEFMEAGRALLRGFVTDKTTLIASSHRDFAITEKIAMGDGRQNTQSVRRAAENTAGRFIEADMGAAAEETGAVISAVLFGALAGSGALPISRQRFEDAIRKSGRAVDSNLAGFARGFAIAGEGGRTAVAKGAETNDAPALLSGGLIERMRREFPPETHEMLSEGVTRTLDYQDTEYAALYLERVKAVADAEKDSGGDARQWRLTRETGKYLALWMTYEDAVRVADLKTRATRFARFRDDVRAAPGQIVNVSEYMHPRVEEICDLLPASVAKAVLHNNILRASLGKLLGGGRRMPTTALRGFLPLYVMASLRFMRRSSYRFALEQARIERWLEAIRQEASHNHALASEIARLQRLIKGYGETFERGLGNFNRIMDLLPEVRKQVDPAATLAGLRDAALQDEAGKALALAIRGLSAGTAAA